MPEAWLPSKDTSCLTLFGTLVLALISFKHVSYYNNIPLDLKDRCSWCGVRTGKLRLAVLGAPGIFSTTSVNTHTIDQL